LANTLSGDLTGRTGIQKVLIFDVYSGFPFDFAQGGEPVDPRISSRIAGFVWNDSFLRIVIQLRSRWLDGYAPLLKGKLSIINKFLSGLRSTAERQNPRLERWEASIAANRQKPSVLSTVHLQVAPG
jgi:hypothetical protein